MASINNDAKSISVVGLGNMGFVLAQALLKNGYRTTVWNRSPAKAQPLVQLGAILVGSATECLKSSRTTIICIVSNNTLLQLLKEDASGLDLSGRTIINLTNGTPNDVAEASAFLQEKCGAKAYMHGAIIVPPPLIGKPEGLTLYAGPRDAFDGNLPALQALGKPQFVAENTKHVSLLDNALLSIMCGLISGFTQALALIRNGGEAANGLTQVDYTNVWAVPLATRFVSWFPRIAAAAQEGKFEVQEGGSPLSMMLEAMDNIANTLNELGVSPELMEGLHRVMKRAVEEGKGNYGSAGLVKLLVTKAKV